MRDEIAEMILAEYRACDLPADPTDAQCTAALDPIVAKFGRKTVIRVMEAEAIRVSREAGMSEAEIQARLKECEP